ncbi:hypothetical protein C8F04DRAFT_1175296 [Mycena alexandri]|uniref:Uncharacterized protein n=1 Tax=Mycena alexandri TaxID=1745969 RepID=A0AAD6XD03_9AGAR|nr:hypothetical protein C8F04DRAFT_1175296 [Mycena alexandri]
MPDELPSESEEENLTAPEDEEELVQPAQNVGRPVRTRTARGDNGAFPTTRKDAAVADARAAEMRAKQRRAETKSRRATVKDAVDEDDAEIPAGLVEEEPILHANTDDEYEYWAFSAAVSDDEPKTWKQAQNSPFSEEWREAYQAELDSIKLHGVYELVARESVPAGRKIIRSRPIFKIKRG